MQNRYVGDAGDFGKYGLLRALSGTFQNTEPGLSLGVIWFLVSRAEANNDGKHDSYLNLNDDKAWQKNEKLYSDCDSALHRLLKEIRQQKRLSVNDIHNSGIFPSGTKFFDGALTFGNFRWTGPSTKDLRVKHRKEWFNGALKVVDGSELVFVDPDNGLEVKSTPFHAMRSPKHVFYEELLQLYEQGHSLVVYHHLGMHGDHLTQAKARAKELDQKLGAETKTIGLRYRRGTARMFYIKARGKDYEKLLKERVQGLLGSSWGSNEHFDHITS